jgi:hypothetical protein
LSLISPEPAVPSAGEPDAEGFVARARLEGHIVVTLTPKGGTGKPVTLTIPLEATIGTGGGLISAGFVEE